MNSTSARKNALEPLAYAGAFDSFGLHRAQYFHTDEKDKIHLIEKAIRFGNQWRISKSSNQGSLFGNTGGEDTYEPPVPKCEEWPLLSKLKLEKEAIGMYISGHPLDEYQAEIEHFTHCSLNDIELHSERDIRVAGIVTGTQTKISKNGNSYLIFTMEDFTGNREFSLFNKDFLAFRQYFEFPGAMVIVSGKYQPLYYNKDRYEFKISRVELLSELREKSIQNLSIHIAVEEVNESLLTDLQDIFSAHPGKTNLNLVIHNRADAFIVKMLSKKVKVQFSTQLIKELKVKGIVHVKINE